MAKFRLQLTARQIPWRICWILFRCSLTGDDVGVPPPLRKGIRPKHSNATRTRSLCIGNSCQSRANENRVGERQRQEQSFKRNAAPMIFRPNPTLQAARAILHMLQFAVAYFSCCLAMHYHGTLLFALSSARS
jgi:hypothetical protein